jgi:hypothetical protein
MHRLTEEQKARAVMRRIAAVERRIKVVPPSERAGLMEEYQRLLAHRDTEMRRLLTEMTGLFHGRSKSPSQPARQLGLFGNG